MERFNAAGWFWQGLRTTRWLTATAAMAAVGAGVAGARPGLVVALVVLASLPLVWHATTLPNLPHLWLPTGVQLTTDRLRIAAVAAEDVEEYLELFDDDYMATNGVTSAMIETVGGATRSPLFRRHATRSIGLVHAATEWGAATRGPTEIAGFIAIDPPTEPDSNEWTAGLHIKRQRRNDGVGAEALQEVLRYLSDDLTWRGPLVISTAIRNEPMLAVLERLGLKRLENRTVTLPDGRHEDAAHYLALPRDDPA